MGFRDDDRGVTVQVGAVLLFGILVIAMASYQVTVVPAENKQVEFQHSQTVQGQMQDVRNGLVRSAGSGNPNPTSVSMGTRYPERVLFVNPPPASGTLKTVGTENGAVNVSVVNAKLVGGEENARSFWQTSNNTYDTGALVYRPGYNVYGNAPAVVYENTVAYNAFENGRTLELTGQTLVQGNRINLLALRGSLSTSTSGDKTVDVRPVSTWSNTVTLEPTGTDPMFINFTSRMTAATWENSILAGQSNVVGVVDRGSFTDSGVTYHRVAVQLKKGVAYEFRAASVGVGAMTKDEADPDPAYLVVTDPYAEVGNNTDGSLTVEVRDRYNNPLSNADVNVTVDGDHLRVYDASGTKVNETTLRTGADGKVTVEYRAVRETGPGEATWLNVSLPNASGDYQYRNVTGVSVPAFTLGGGGGGGGGGGDVNPGSPGDIIYTEATIQSKDYVVMTLNNTMATTANVSYARMEFYFSSGNKDYEEVNIADGNVPGSSFPSDPPLEMKIGGNYAESTPKIGVAPGDSQVTLEFVQTPGDGDGNLDVQNTHYFVLTIIYEVDGEYTQVRYFVDPK